MILQALNGYYERVSKGADAKIAPPGFSYQKISFAVLLAGDGSVTDVNDLRTQGEKRPQPLLLLLPQPPKKAGIKPPPCFLWDKTAYVFGVERSRVDQTRAIENLQYRDAFRSYHRALLADNEDDGLKSLLGFLGSWEPSRYSSLRYADEMLDTNVVFRLDSNVFQYLHERPAARQLWAKISADAEAAPGLCLVSGRTLPIARLHPSIKNVRGAQSVGASIVSFNQPSFTSYGKEQGANAPVSEQAAFAYTTALNELLRDNGQKVQIADATTVFWAEAAEPKQAEAAEHAASWLFAPPSLGGRDASEVKAITDVMALVEKGKPLEAPELHLKRGTRFYILGLSPNAARLSVRFWEATTLGAIGKAFHQHWRDLRMEQPAARGRPPSVASCALMTAPARRNRQGQVKFSFDDVSPLLAGELMRAILTGTRYPGALLANLVMRIRTDHHLSRLRVSLIKAAIVRAMRIDGKLPTEDYLVRTDPNDPNAARRLGRLFAVLERAQLTALGDNINATIKDKFIGSAAATPAQVFTFLVKNSNHHTARLRRGHADAEWIKDAQHARNVGMGLERDIGRLWGSFNDGLPNQLSTTDQGLFFVGYYQERFGGKADAENGDETIDNESDGRNEP